MKQVKIILTMIALLIGIIIPQMAKAQLRKVTQEDISLMKEIEIDNRAIDIFKKCLEEGQEVPMDKFWENIEIELPEKYEVIKHFDYSDAIQIREIEKK